MKCCKATALQIPAGSARKALKHACMQVNAFVVHRDSAFEHGRCGKRVSILASVIHGSTPLLRAQSRADREMIIDY